MPLLLFFHPKKCSPSAPLHPIVVVDPFEKWGIDFMTCKPTSTRGHSYIIIIVDYFRKWVEVMLTFKADGKTTTLFIFN